MVVVYINTMKTTIYLNILFLPIFQTAETHTNVNRQKLPVNSFSLFICKLVIQKRLVNYLIIINKKSSSLVKSINCKKYEKEKIAISKNVKN